MSDRFVIVGGGLAGASAAIELRAQGFDGDIHLVGAEAHEPYLRPPLSKEYLRGKQAREKIFVKPAQWYLDERVTLTTGIAATAITDHALRLADGRDLGFDRLLLATGAQPRRLDLPGVDADGIHTLRTVDDSELLRERLTAGNRRVVFVGAGWIGLELAAAAREFGNEVTVVAPEEVPLAGPLGTELGSMFRELHESHGVAFRLGRTVTGFAHESGAVTGVITDDGTVPADLVVVGIGAKPDTALAETAGLDIDNGVLVDEHLVTSRADIFAAGDVANAYHPVIGQRMRNEHWATAKATGRVAARSMLGQADAVFDAIPYFYTDQYDLGMEYSGYPPLTKDTRLVYRGDRAAREFVVFWLAGDRVVAGMNVNVWDVNTAVQDLIRSGRAVDDSRLSDPGVELGAV